MSAASSTKARKSLDALFCDKIKINPHVDAGIAKVAVERAVVAVFCQQTM